MQHCEFSLLFFDCHKKALVAFSKKIHPCCCFIPDFVFVIQSPWGPVRAERVSIRESSFICVSSIIHIKLSPPLQVNFLHPSYFRWNLHIFNRQQSHKYSFAKSCCSRSFVSLPALHFLQRSQILYLLLPLILAPITSTNGLLPRLLLMDLRLLQVQSAPNLQRRQASRTRHRPVTL